jgi:TP901 family phage tail tape measure protein
MANVKTVTITIDAAQAEKEMKRMEQLSERLGKKIADMKKQLDDPNMEKTSAAWKQLEKDYKAAKKEQRDLNKLIDEGKLAIKGIDDVMDNLSKSTYNELIKQQRILQKAIKSTKPNTDDYVKIQKALRGVNDQLDELRNGWKAHDGQIMSTIKRLASYVAVYGGYNYIAGKIKEVTSAWLALSDTLSDVQKTTGLAGDELNILSKDIDSIDTRSTQQQLHDLAATAGQIGLKSRADVFGFVKSANQLTVALNELGDEGVQSLAKIAELTGDIERLGVEKAMIAIGSSINELSANSAATAGPIAEFIRRTGGIAPMAKLATSDLAAMGATADALGQQMEVSGTAMSKFISSVVNNTEGISYALNMDSESLRNLIDTGQTMEAIIQILEKVKSETAKGGDVLGEIFKEFGSEGERMSRVLISLSENTGFLREQVELSTKAFAEAKSVTQEYNVKNENAAAIVERIGNVWREFAVNASGATAITGVLKLILNLSKTLLGASNAGIALRNAILALGTALASAKIGLVDFVKGLFAAEKGINSASVAWGRFTKMLKANWVSLLIGAVVGLVNAIINWNKEQKRLNESIAQLNSELQKEKTVLDELNKALKIAGENQESYKDIITQLNSEYGKYLGFQVSEAAGYEEIARALALVNEQLDLKYAKMIYDKRMEKANAKYEEDTEKAALNITSKLGKILPDAKNVSSVYGDLLSAIKDTASEMKEPIGQFDNIGDVMDKIYEKVEGLSGIDWRKKGGYIDGIREMLNAEIALNNARINASEEMTANVEQQEKDLAKARTALLDEQKKQMDALLAMTEDELVGKTEQQLKDHYKRILVYGENLLAAERQKFNKAKEEIDTEVFKPGTDAYTAEVKALLAPIEALEDRLKETRKLYAGDAWGKLLNVPGWKEALGNLENLGTASVDNLVKIYKEMEEGTTKYTSVDQYNQIFGTTFTKIDDMQKHIYSNAEKIKARLAELGRTTTGAFLWGGDSNSEWEQEQKRQLEAAKSALEAHYREEEAIIAQSYLNREITYEEMNRRLSANNAEMQRSFVDLYNVLLGEAKEYETDFVKLLPGKDLELLGKNLMSFGPSMIEGLRNSREQNEVKIREEAIKMRRIVEEAMLEGDMFGKLTEQFRETLDELSLLAMNFGKTFDAVDEKTAKELVAQLTGMADEAYTMTEKELLAEAKERSKGNEILTAWWSGVDDSQLTLILEKLKIYYDNRLDMQRKYAQRMQREWLQYYKQTGAQAEYEANKRMIEEAGSAPEGYVKDAGDYNEERGIIAARAALEAEKVGDNIAYIEEQIKARSIAINAEIESIIERNEKLMESMDPNSSAYKILEEDTKKWKMYAVEAGDEEAVALNAEHARLTQEYNAIIQQSEIDTTNVTIEQWQKRAEALGEWAEMVGETMGEVYMLERQANNARARGDEETAKKLEAQAKESRQNLVKEALNKAIDMAKVWAMELGFKVMYNALAQKSDEKLAAASANATVKEVLADILAQGFKGAGKEIGSKGIAGLVTGGAIIMAAAGLAALAKSAVANMFPEATEGVNSPEASSPKRKLTTGMLTYAEGKYPVLGNDGVVYDAEYAGSNMKTGVYRKPHFGIFAEKQPEMVIDGKTTQRLVLNYPEVYNGILQLSRTGRMGMRTYNDGNVSEFAAVSAQQQIQMEEMRQTMAATAAAVAALTRRLEQPINASVNYFGKGGQREAEQRGSRWATRNRVK